MRYNDRLTFITEKSGGYNPVTGEHEEASITTDKKPCNLSPLGVERSNQLFGEIDTNIQIARLQRPYKQSFSHIEIDGKKFNVKKHVKHRSQSVFYLEGGN